MDLDKIQSLLERKNKDYSKNMMYSRGKNPTILGQRAKSDPDNRIPIPLAKMAIETEAGYFAKPGNIQVNYTPIDDTIPDTGYDAIIDRWENENFDGVHISELVVECLSQGVAYELFWVSPEDDPDTSIKPEWAMVPGNQIYVKKTDSLKPEIEYAVRFWSNENDQYAKVYYPFFAEGYKNQGGKWVPVPDMDETYIFSRVPIIEYSVNYQMEPMFEAEKTIIDKHDDVVSASQNEVDRFNALMLLFPGKVTKEFVDKLKETKLFEDLGIFEADKWPKYLEKNLGGVNEFYTTLTDRLERLFHKSIKVPDFLDPNFTAGDESGVARAFKVLGMEYKTAIYEAYFSKGLNQRKALFDDIFKQFPKYRYQDYKTEIMAKRNLPIDEVAKVNLAILLKGLGVSDETILKMLPKTIVQDWRKELELMEARVVAPDFMPEDPDAV
jgi:SPP1 family phage portal protein